MTRQSRESAQFSASGFLKPVQSGGIKSIFHRENGLLLLNAALLMTFGSMTSFLFPLHTGVDQNCFLTVAKAWESGKLPYAEIYEQKGPLLYFLHLPAAVLPSFLGVYFLQIALWFGILCAFCRLTAICLPRSSVHTRSRVALWSAIVIITAFCYSRGDNAEEYCLLPVTLSLGDLLLQAKKRGAVSKGMMIRNGIFAGCVLWIKFSMLGFYIGFCICIGLWLWKDCGGMQALKAALLFLLGMGLISLPVLVYFGLHHALGALTEVYFITNATRYPRKVPLSERILDFFRKDLLWNPVMMGLILLGVGVVLSGRIFQADLREKLAIMLTLVLLYGFVFIGGVRYRYYLLILGAYVPLGVMAVHAAAVPYLQKRRKIWKRVEICAYPVILLLAGNCSYFLGKPRSYYPQIQFAEQIPQGAVLLNYGFLDGGFTLMSGAKLPESRFFCKLNISREALPEMYEEQERIITEGKADYAVIRKEMDEEWSEKYDFAPFFEEFELIDEAEEPHDGYCYRLYRRRASASS